MILFIVVVVVVVVLVTHRHFKIHRGSPINHDSFWDSPHEGRYIRKCVLFLCHKRTFMSTIYTMQG